LDAAVYIADYAVNINPGCPVGALVADWRSSTHGAVFGIVA